jgi:mRNA interferase RelE/StbE
LQRLEESPEKQGKPLTGDLKGYYSVRVADQRYRIIYRIQTEKQTIFVEFIGIRRQGSKSDVYVLFSHLRDES